MNSRLTFATILIVSIATIGWKLQNPDSGPLTSFARNESSQDAPLIERPVANAPGRDLVAQPNCPDTIETKASTSVKDSQLHDLLTRSKQNVAFVLPSADEVSRFEGLLRTTVSGKFPIDQLSSNWSQAGWELTSITGKKLSALVISEQDGQRRGRGIFVVRIECTSKLVLQAPHRFFDLGTGTITRQLFEEQQIRAAAWNTVHRNQFDWAHRKDHFLNAFTKVMLELDDQIVIAQIHGFANDNQTGVSAKTELIVSDATKYPGRTAGSSLIHFRQNFPDRDVRLFPLDVSVLGGTTNEQAAIVREAGENRFLHLELNPIFRKKLEKSFKARAAFYQLLSHFLCELAGFQAALNLSLIAWLVKSRYQE